MDIHQGNNTVIDRLLELTDKVPQLRESARRAIRLAQQQLDEKFAEHLKKEFKEGDLVLYYDKAKAMQHHTKLEPK